MTHSSCTAVLSNRIFTLSNDLISRSWSLDGEGRLSPCSLIDRRSGTEWLQADASALPVLPEGQLPHEPRETCLEISRGVAGPTEEPSLTATLIAQGRQSRITTVFQIFPQSASVSLQQSCEGSVTFENESATAVISEPTGIETAVEGRVLAGKGDCVGEGADIRITIPEKLSCQLTELLFS